MSSIQSEYDLLVSLVELHSSITPSDGRIFFMSNEKLENCADVGDECSFRCEKYLISRDSASAVSLLAKKDALSTVDSDLK